MKDLTDLIKESSDILNDNKFDNEVNDEMLTYNEKLLSCFKKFNKTEIENFITILLQEVFWSHDNIKESKKFFDELLAWYKK